jgi:carbamoyl-phosphate synthase large subunit
MNVGVSGVGGAVGQSIMKALSVSKLPVNVFAIDVHPLSAGLFMAEEAMVLPKPEARGGLSGWEQGLRENGVDSLIPGSDHDLPPLASVREEWERNGLCNVLVSDPELIQAGRDKALTCEALKNAGLPAPESVWDLTLEEAIAWAKSNGYPVILKPREGSASRGVVLVQNLEELTFYFPRTPKPIIQEYLSKSGQDEEFTCAVFVDKTGTSTGTFMARRELNSGTTYRAEIGFWPEINDLLVAIGSALRPRGVLNVQIRMTERGPVPHELNVRCSGTTAIRAHFGYNEPEMLLRHYVLGEEVSQPDTRIGYAFRYWNEVFLEDSPVSQSNQKGTILAWP